MNKTISLAAIAMVAVIMGMSAIAPAIASPSGGGGEKHNPKVAICHFDFNEMQWEADKMVNKHALIAHLAHGDKLIHEVHEDPQHDDHITVLACLAQDPLDPPVV